MLGLHRLADRAGAGLEQRRLAGHDDLFGHAAGLEREVDDRLLLDGDGDAAPHTLLEAWELRLRPCRRPVRIGVKMNVPSAA